MLIGWIIRVRVRLPPSVMASALSPPLDLPVMLANRVPSDAIFSALQYSTESRAWCSERKALDILLMSQPLRLCATLRALIISFSVSQNQMTKRGFIAFKPMSSFTFEGSPPHIFSCSAMFLASHLAAVSFKMRLKTRLKAMSRGCNHLNVVSVRRVRVRVIDFERHPVKLLIPTAICS